MIVSFHHITKGGEGSKGERVGRDEREGGSKRGRGKMKNAAVFILNT